VPVFRVELGGEGYGAFDVYEEDGDLFALALEGGFGLEDLVG
jgi:hypothetical protein